MANLNVNENNTANLPAWLLALLIVSTWANEMTAGDTLACTPQPEPMTVEVCEDVCEEQGLLVKRVEAWACECMAEEKE